MAPIFELRAQARHSKFLNAGFRSLLGNTQTNTSIIASAIDAVLRCMHTLFVAEMVTMNAERCRETGDSWEVLAIEIDKQLWQGWAKAMCRFTFYAVNHRLPYLAAANAGFRS